MMWICICHEIKTSSTYHSGWLFKNAQYLVAVLTLVAINKQFRALPSLQHTSLCFISLWPLFWHCKVKDEGGREAYTNLTMALFLVILYGYNFLGYKSWKKPLKWRAESFQ